ncbi:DUF4177 domain-containing protein [Bacillus sp. 1P06AnD]|uniref:DUF4177 domain-containing protein n=1 Tax=Bacillus sp. 1P06AnD TaxID=3132208 RepID=UPI0039A0B37B
MIIYKYRVSSVDQALNSKESLKELANYLNHYGENGYQLKCTMPQLQNGETGSTVLIFEKEDHNEENTFG